MLHKILTGGSNARSDPQAAVNYVLGSVDSTGHTRPHPPVVLGGSTKAFLRMAKCVAKGPKYLSTALSGNEPANLPAIRYISDVFLHNYLAGIPREAIGNVTVLHVKDESWDAHLLTALAIANSFKKARFVRHRIDYLRFARLRCLVNQMLGWRDPLDPTNLRPAHFAQPWRQKSAVITDLDKLIKAAFQTKAISCRSDLVALIESSGFQAIVGEKNISVLEGNKQWILRGYASTKHADCAEKLAKYLGRTAQPFEATMHDPRDVRKKVLDAYKQAVNDNRDYLRIVPVRVPDGLIVPDQQYYEENYTPSQISADKSAAKLGGGDDLVDSPRHSNRPQQRDSRTAGVTGQIDPQSRSLRHENQRTGETIICHGRAVKARAGDRGRRQPKPPKGTRDNDGIVQEIARWGGLILWLWRFPRWYRKHKAKQRQQWKETLNSRRLRFVGPVDPKAYIQRLLRRPQPVFPATTPQGVAPTKNQSQYEPNID